MLVGIKSPRMGATYCICGDRNTHSPLPVKEGTKQPTNPAEATILWTGSSWHDAAARSSDPHNYRRMGKRDTERECFTLASGPCCNYE